MKYFAHPSAVIDSPVQIGAGTRIWHFSHIMANARIGQHCNLGQNVFVAGGVHIGDNCKIQNNVSLYEGVTLEDHVFCGPSMVFTNIKHPRCEIVRRGEYQSTYVERGATFGANCTVVCGVRVGQYALIGAGAVVTGDVPAYGLMAGCPARRIGWAGRAGYRLEPDPERDGCFLCPSTGQRYIEEDPETLRPEPQPCPPSSPRPVPLLDLKAQYRRIRPEIRSAIDRVMESQGFILGPEVQRFEDEAAQYIGIDHTIGCASGSDALLLALMCLQANPGDEIITVPYTFFSTVGSIVRLGLRPVFCDIDPVTFNMNPDGLHKLIGERTRAILPVHLFGQCAPMQAIQRVAQRHNIPVIEDAAQAIGARDMGRATGTTGRIGCFSFFPSKNLGAFGDGGLLSTADEAVAERLRSLRVHGAGQTKYEHHRVGINSRLDALQAAVLRVKLRHLDAWSDARAANADAYRKMFDEAGVVQASGSTPEPGRLIPPQQTTERHIYNQFVIRVHESQRNPLQAHLKARSIGTAIYYPRPLHLQPCFKQLGHAEGDFPEAERASRQTLALPIFSELQRAQQERVVAEIVEFLEGRAGKTRSSCIPGPSTSSPGQ